MWDAPTLNVLGHCSDIGSSSLPFPPVIWFSTPQRTGQRPAKGYLPYGSQNCCFFAAIPGPRKSLWLMDENKGGVLFSFYEFSQGPFYADL